MNRLGQTGFKIWCDNKVIHIGAGLYGAFMRLRDPTKKRSMWINQICINQNNITERDSQVQLMRDIYFTAVRVILWIGEKYLLTVKAFEITHKLSFLDKDTFSDAMELLESIRSGNISFDEILIREKQNQLDRVVDNAFPISSLVESNEQLDFPSRAEWVAFSDLFYRPVFEQVWIIQEICVANTVIIICGPYQINWPKVARVARILEYKSWFFTVPMLMGSTGEVLMRSLHNYHVVNMNSIRQGYMWSEIQNWPWSKILLRGCNFTVTNSRNHVFAFFGIAGTNSDERKKLLVPRYSDSVIAIFTKTMQGIISLENSI